MKIRWLGQWLLLATLLLSARSARADEVPIIYSRCPRASAAFDATGPLVKGGVTTMATVRLKYADLLEPLPDTARNISNFLGPCDLVHRDAQGVERILYSCIAEATPGQACAALDGAVSFDAKTVAMAVFRGSLERLRGSANGTIFDPAAENLAAFYVELPGSVIQPTESQIVLVDIATGRQTPLPFPAGTQNFGPAWLSNGRLAFSSNRRAVYGPMPSCGGSSPLSVQLHAMDVDGRNVELVSPHALAAELHPLQLSDGRVAVSSWQLFGMLAFRHGNSFSGCGTLANFFHMYAQNPDGSNANAVYGQHLTDAASTTEYDQLGTHLAAHFFGQTSDGRVWSGEYYRANNLGLGSVVGFPLPPRGEEGPSVADVAGKAAPYRPWEEVRLAAWATNGDFSALNTPDPPLMLAGYADPIRRAGKLGHPSGLPGNRLMVTWGVGTCSVASGKLDLIAMRDQMQVFGDNPGCDVGIYRTEELPASGTSNILKHPSELVPIVNSPDYQEFFARPAVPYSEIYGVERPALIPRAELASDRSLEHGTPFGVLGASSIIHRETHAAKPIGFEDMAAAEQGTDTIDYDDDELCGVRILAVHSNRKVESTWKSTSMVGERVAILGEFSVRKWDAGGSPVLDALGAPDTSFRVRFPADSPYLMQAIDCAGRTLNTDQTWQSLRPGEVKTCNGCHVHSHAASKLPFASTWAAGPTATTFELGAGKVPLLAGGSGPSVATKDVDGYQYMVEFDRDVMPILAARCVSCHGEARAEAGLRLDIPRVWANVAAKKDDSSYARLALDFNQVYVPAALQHTGSHAHTLGKPNLSKYVRMMNSRGSLLYWKASNARTDNRTDAQQADDVDFGAAHPTDATPAELGVISRWIDTGAGWGPELTQDTTYPVLHVVGVASGTSVEALRIGTADVGDGIDASSLNVCVVPQPSEPCGPNLASEAALSGVVSVTLTTPLTNPDAEVVASVMDRAGNLTESRHTVRFLLDLPPPDPLLFPSNAGAPSNSGSGGTSNATGPADGENGGIATGASSVPGKRAGCGCTVAGGDREATPLIAFVLAAFAGALRQLRARGRQSGSLLLTLATGCASPPDHAQRPPELQNTGTSAGNGQGGGSSGGSHAPSTNAAGTPSAAAGGMPSSEPPIVCPEAPAGSASDQLKPIHHDGQTFVTWQDAAEGSAGERFRYNVYRASAPITESSLSGATVVAQGLLNNSAKLFGTAFNDQARLDIATGMSIVEEGGAPLPPWSGLFVHTATAEACAYYAVLATDLSGQVMDAVLPGKNATTAPVTEHVAPLQPIKLYHSEDRASNKLSGTKGLPLMVTLHPSQAQGGGAGPWGDAYLYFANQSMGYVEGLPGLFSVQEEVLTGVPTLMMVNRDTLLLPNGKGALETYWFGYQAVPQWAEASAPLAYPFTERRLLWMIEQIVTRHLANPDAVSCSGGSMGAWGATSFCFRHPEVFAAVYPDRPRTRQTGLPALVSPPDANAALMDDGVTPYLERMDSVKFAAETPDDLPFYAWNIGRKDGFAPWQDQVDMVAALTTGHHGFAFMWNNGGHGDGSALAVPLRTMYPPAKFGRHESYPAFGHSSLDDELGDGSATSGVLQGGINLGFDWQLLSDEADQWSCSLSNSLAIATMTVDVTPRRAQRFVVQPGAAVHWASSSGAAGTVQADVHGHVTVPSVALAPRMATVLTLQK